MSQGTFSDLLIRLGAFKRIFVFRPKIEVLPRSKLTLFSNNEQIFKSTFFTLLCP